MTTSNSSTSYYMRYNRDANSYSVFERGRLNEFNEPYCVLAMVTQSEAEAFIANPHLQPEVAQTGVYAPNACQWTDGEQTFTGPHQWSEGRCATCGLSAALPLPSTPWRVSDIPTSQSDVPWSVKDGDGVVIADFQTERLAALFSATPALVAALRDIQGVGHVAAPYDRGAYAAALQRANDKLDQVMEAALKAVESEAS